MTVSERVAELGDRGPSLLGSRPGVLQYTPQPPSQEAVRHRQTVIPMHTLRPDPLREVCLERHSDIPKGKGALY